MPYSRKFSSRRKTYKKRAYKRKSYAPKRKMSYVKKVVRREIARNVEDKNSQLFVTTNRLYVPGNASFPTNNIFPVCIEPTAIVIPQGTGQGNRIGNRIKIKKFQFKGTLVPQPYDATFNPQPLPVQVKMWIFYDKKFPTDVPNPTVSNDFFQNGSSATGFSNDLIDMWRPVNTDRYRILATKTFKLGPASNTGSGAVPTLQNLANNDFKYNVNFSFELAKHMPKVTIFEDGGIEPTTRGTYCMIQYVSATGSGMPVTSYAVESQWMLNCVYEDA